MKIFHSQQIKQKLSNYGGKHHMKLGLGNWIPNLGCF